MKRNKLVWSIVLAVSVLLLIGYYVFSSASIRYGNYGQYGRGYYGRGMMDRWFNPNSNWQYENYNKLSVDQIKNNVNAYIKGYGSNLKLSDIFVYKDTDYYVSIEESDTGKGAMELLVNPYTGDVYPEYGPNMMWNTKYGMMGGGGMMGGPYRGGMMGGPWGGYRNLAPDASNKVMMDEAASIADNYVKSNLSSNYSVKNTGHEFYGYYTFHVYKGDRVAGMISVNYYTKDVWYHNWHGDLEQVILNDKI